jgi:hypothetical protein
VLPDGAVTSASDEVDELSLHYGLTDQQAVDKSRTYRALGEHLPTEHKRPVAKGLGICGDGLKGEERSMIPGGDGEITAEQAGDDEESNFSEENGKDTWWEEGESDEEDSSEDELSR